MLKIKNNIPVENSNNNPTIFQQKNDKETDLDSIKKEIKESIDKYADLSSYLKDHSLNEFNANWVATYYLAYRLANKENDTELLNKLNEVNKKIEEYAKQNGFGTSTYDISKFDGKHIEEIKNILESEFKVSNLETVSKMGFVLINKHMLDLKPLLRDLKTVNENKETATNETSPLTINNYVKEKQEEAKNVEKKPATIQNAHAVQANKQRNNKNENNDSSESNKMIKFAKKTIGLSLLSLIGGGFLDWGSLHYVALMGAGLLGLSLVATGMIFLPMGVVEYMTGLYMRYREKHKKEKNN